MQPVQLPALPQEVLACIACATLEADGGRAQAWARFRLVCRSWRDSIRSASSAAALSCRAGRVFCWPYRYAQCLQTPVGRFVRALSIPCT